MVITLPASLPRRAWLTSFWLAACLVGGTLVSLLLAWLVSPVAAVLGGIAAVILALPGIRWPWIAALPYRLWNKLAHTFSSCARFYVMSICFYLVFIVAGRCGSSLKLAPPSPGDSLWAPRGPGLDGGWQEVSLDGSSRKGWVSAYLSHAVRSGNGWACCLLPFFLLLALFEAEETHGIPPSSIYTLY
jgi:hypothetical protein